MLYNTNPKVDYATDSPCSIRLKEVTLHTQKKNSFVLLPSCKM